MNRMLLGVNIDHVATLRQARRGSEPSVLDAALIAQDAGADLITIHLREDRRHIQDQDVFDIKQAINIPLNLEMAPVDEIIEIALRVKPYKVTLVPEKREEVTTEGGLDVLRMEFRLSQVVDRFTKAGVIVSLFIEADDRQIEASARVKAPCVEFHTGQYANATGQDQAVELERLRRAVKTASKLDIEVHLGHGLNYENIEPFKEMPEIQELNIGHTIISRAVLDGLSGAIQTMRSYML